MEKEYVDEISNQLKKKELSELYVKREDFLDFRKHLVGRDDFKHFRGIAQRGGDVLYRYMDTPRS
ncbi:hypothetical protein LS684_07060 [Cytobacillus spongiae]|uniref:hypothetical protein n=1 Tax=Cytobacillus spongiae TaxID=2901381 RepID=UPI001F362CA0|nr:hypothetical protein [Cytobacillus spongiae]UII57194.1 hypothetical protein LS684_07060 [Cytobacillus spongiae]